MGQLPRSPDSLLILGLVRASLETLSHLLITRFPDPFASRILYTHCMYASPLYKAPITETVGALTCQCLRQGPGM